MGKFGGYEIHRFPNYYVIGDYEGNRPYIYNSSKPHKKIATARSEAYQAVMKWGDVTHVFAPSGYYETKDKAYITHYVSVGKVMKGKDGMLWVSDGKKYRLFKNGNIRRI